MATTFCTNHIRMFGVNLTRMLRRDPIHTDCTEKVFAHGSMLLCFIAGVLLAALLCRWLGTYTIWVTLLPLIILFLDLLHADLTTEHDKLEITPHGH